MFSIVQPKILVAGGSGFLGKAIVKELLEPDCPFQPAEIRILDVNPYTGVQNEKISFIQGDIRDYHTVEKACKGITLVIHLAAIIDWGTHTAEEILAVNTGGTENIINACKKLNAPFLVYTRSLDAVFTGKPLVNIDESQPYPNKPVTSYCDSKIRSEKLVKAATSESLKTCILRPSDIYGEADPYHIGSLINMAKTGFYVRLGNGKSKCQHVYVGNMAHAHILAANALFQNNRKVFGKAYLITDGPGSNFFTFFDKIVKGAGYKIFPKNLWIPKWLAYTIGAAAEFGAWLISPIKKYNPKFSRFAVVYTCNDFTFTSERANADFGWAPKYTTAQAIENTVTYYKKQSM
ncbi:MAG TPA: NAD-dependent epimerase/dehydratase family protein [Draconibacterium sp.]|nr:NAD-dependent epimerase/dehydratase family protein [Draconibacterium sp.]